jgi:hypothetical protein
MHTLVRADASGRQSNQARIIPTTDSVGFRCSSINRTSVSKDGNFLVLLLQLAYIDLQLKFPHAHFHPVCAIISFPYCQSGVQPPSQRLGSAVFKTEMNF